MPPPAHPGEESLPEPVPLGMDDDMPAWAACRLEVSVKASLLVHAGPQDTGHRLPAELRRGRLLWADGSVAQRDSGEHHMLSHTTCAAEHLPPIELCSLNNACCWPPHPASRNLLQEAQPHTNLQQSFISLHVRTWPALQDQVVEALRHQSKGHITALINPEQPLGFSRSGKVSCAHSYRPG